MGFLEQYFIDPVLQGTGYNVVNTLTYAVILIIAVFATYRLLRKMKIAIDDNFVLGVLPYIILGGLLRALEDAFSYGFWFKTPIIYFVIFVIAFVSLFVSKLAEMSAKRRLPYYKIWSAIGFALVLAGLTQVVVKSIFALVAMLSLTALWIVLLLLAKKLTNRKTSGPGGLSGLFTRENTSLIAVHMFDATTTFTAIQYFPYFEQHVLPSFLIGIFGPAVMFVLKFAVVAAVLYVLDKELKKESEKEKRKFIKLVILILGLAPGLRNFFRLVMGV